MDDETVAEAIDGLRDLEGNAWLFPCHPKTFPIDDDTFADQIEDWPVTTYRDHLAFGDAAVFWVTGKEAGAYAVGRVAGELFRAEAIGSATAAEDEGWRCPLELFVDLFEVPVRKSELLADPRFIDASIIRAPHAASPHLLTTDQLAAILDLALVPWWARATSPLARRVAVLVQEVVEAAAVGPFDELPVIDLANEAWAAELGVGGDEVGRALKELFFVTREQAIADADLGFTFNTARD